MEIFDKIMATEGFIIILSVLISTTIYIYIYLSRYVTMLRVFIILNMIFIISVFLIFIGSVVIKMWLR